VRALPPRDHLAAQRCPLLWLADRGVERSNRTFEIKRNLVVTTAFDGCFGSRYVSGRIVHSPGVIARRCKEVELCPTPVVDFFRRTNELFGPAEWFMLFDAHTDKRRVDGDGCGAVEIAVVGGPPERGAQVRQFETEPGVGLALAWTVP
jgi:hypothetical protein